MIPLIIHKLSDTHTIAFAKINYKQEEILFNQLKELSIDLNPLKSISNLNRRMEWMAIRMGVIQLLGEQDDIIYNEENKPHLVKSPFNLSLSHSKEMIAISINKKSITGIDIQHISSNIANIKGKFLNEHELIRCSDNPIELSFYWSMKEALFKVYGKNDAFLKQNFEITQYMYDHDNNMGSAIGLIEVNEFKKELQLEFHTVEDYVIAYVVNP